MSRRLGTVIVAAALALAAPAAAHAKALPGTPVPAGFVGVNMDGPLVTPQDNIDLGSQLQAMHSNSVESVRVPFSWAGAQPYASWSDVPFGQESQFIAGAGNVPTNFSATDQIVMLAAHAGLTVLPTVIYTPGWDAITNPRGLARPRDPGPYGEFLTTLIGRYGPRGSFWSDNPTVPMHPIRKWQIWNEPELTVYWAGNPWPSTYVDLLRVADEAVKTADPGAKVVLGGLADYSWENLQLLYQQPGFKGYFDVVDVHPYTRLPIGVIKIVSFVRQEISSAHDTGKSIIVGETSWLSSLGHTKHLYDWETTQAGQAQRIRQLLPMLAANRRALGLAAFYWYTWIGAEFRHASPWGFAGLVALRGGQIVSKPALGAFQRAAKAIER